VAHVVLYTDHPTADGYPYSQAAVLPGQATVAALDPSAGYRFAVVAVDDQGVQGPPSNELVLAASGPACTVTCDATAATTAARREPVGFTGAVTAANCSAPVVVEWTFGDGASARGAALSHAFAAAGTYSWEMTARSGASTCSAAGTLAVSDADPAPRRQLRRHLTPPG
jgi:chitodextrinase